MTITFKEIMERDKKETLDYHNFEEWHELGYKGQGYNFLEIEDVNSEHGKMVFDTVKEYAPESTGYLGNMRHRVKGDEVLFCDIEYYGAYIPIEQFVKELNIHVIGASLSNASEGMPQPLIDYLKELPVIYVGSAGNDGHVGVTGKFEYLGLMSGAIYLDNGEIKRERYSGVEDTMDFATLHSWPDGTSFSSPVLAGMIAVIMSKYGFMTQAKMKEVLKSISIDAGEEGHDPCFGYGVPILPENGVIDMLENEIDNKLYTVDEIIEKLKDYDKKEFHIHHTWAPDLDDFTGDNHERLQDGMRNYHIYERGFEDIAQHITQFPDGKFMIGRDFAKDPNSSAGKRLNGRSWNQDFVFMVENIGNFDNEEIPKVVWDNNVKIGAYFLANKGTVIFHRQMDSSKSCPGNKFDYEKYINEVINLVEGTEQEKEHWAEKHFKNLKAKGIIIHERRFEDDIDRDETFAMLDRVTDDYIERIDVLQKQINEIKNS